MSNTVGSPTGTTEGNGKGRCPEGMAIGRCHVLATVNGAPYYYDGVMAGYKNSRVGAPPASVVGGTLANGQQRVGAAYQATGFGDEFALCSPGASDWEASEGPDGLACYSNLREGAVVRFGRNEW